MIAPSKEPCDLREGRAARSTVFIASGALARLRGVIRRLGQSGFNSWSKLVPPLWSQAWRIECNRKRRCFRYQEGSWGQWETEVTSWVHCLMWHVRIGWSIWERENWKRFNSDQCHCERSNVWQMRTRNGHLLLSNDRGSWQVMTGNNIKYGQIAHCLTNYASFPTRPLIAFVKIYNFHIISKLVTR